MCPESDKTGHVLRQMTGQRREPTRHIIASDADADAIIHTIAERQYGVVARDQLVAAGVPEHRITYRVKKRRLVCVYRGVYRVGPVSGSYATQMAAVLACGPTALLSHDSALAVWARGMERVDSTTVHVIIQRANRLPGSNVRVHRVRALHPDEVTRWEGIPITQPARTLLDLAGTASPRLLEQAWSELERQGLVTSQAITALLARYPGRAGARRLRVLLGRAHRAMTRSEAEELFLGNIRSGGLGNPEVNAAVVGYEVDFFWRAERLIVEIDGFAFHSSRIAFERDRARDAELMAAGFRVLRVTWRQMLDTPNLVLVRVAQALAR